MTTHWHRLAHLPLRIDSYELERLATEPLAGMEDGRVTTHIRLRGAGAEGIGEEIGMPQDQVALQAAGPCLSLAGEWTLEAFCDHLATLEHWPQPPEWEPSRRYRSWAYESAALDLALRQARSCLPEVLGRTTQPVRFVNSLGLGEPACIEPIRRRLQRSPSVGFKLDAAPDWTAALMRELAATEAVETIDFKGRYGFEVDDAGALVTLYERVLEHFPDATLEDPHDLPQIAALLADHHERVAYDAPIHDVADLAATPLAAGTVNVKPSRIGCLRALLELYEHCDARGLRMYGGGMGELGVGRTQIQLLASLFHADAPNDVAPSAFNLDDPPAKLPASPLAVQPAPQGFRWER